MTVRALVGVIRFAAATYMELHRFSVRWWAEEIDRAAGREDR